MDLLESIGALESKILGQMVSIDTFTSGTSHGMGEWMRALTWHAYAPISGLRRAHQVCIMI